MQMSQVHLNVPLIVMDGAGVYDAGEGEYFHTEPITQEDSMRLRALMDRNDLLDGEVYHASEIVYFKIVGDEQTISRAQECLQPILAQQSLRTRLRYQADSTTVLGLYIYSSSATMEQAKNWLMARVWKENRRIMPVEFSLPRGYQSEHEALDLLHRVENDYEPIWFWQEVSPGELR